ncbi:MAG TPA: PKD domain-containing protein, partial [Symbiobacteriaceae bacterium]|nr:PKD domain-containing protein [Symbiobacteriaceae bacterium]
GNVVVDLSGSSSKVALSFWHWYQTENGFDVLYVLGSGDGGNSFQVLNYYTGNSNGWKQAVIDLTPFAGNPNVYLAFYLSTDGSINFPGWYIDDLALYIDNQAPAAPANLRAAADSVGGITLTWDAVDAADLSRYTVYRSTTAGSGYANLGTASRNSYADSTGTPGTTYYYVVTALDMFGNESPQSAEASATPSQGTTVFRDDMEASDNGWTHSGAGDSWQRGTPTAGPATVPSGTHVWGTNLAGNYADGANASLVSPPLNLAGLASATLRFAHWYSVERNYDFGRVEVSADSGASWTQLAAYTAPGGGGAPVGWENVTLDLSAYAGQTVQVRFRLESDGSVNYAGWYVDDVMVAGSATANGMKPPVGPTATQAEPSVKGKAPAPAETRQIMMPTSTGMAPKASGIGIASLPLDATVTVMETGRVVRTDPANGSFRMVLPAGNFTLRAEAYGYFPMDKSIAVERDKSTSAIMLLTAIPKGRITGLVTDGRTGQPVAGAAVSVAEDMRIAPTMTGADGRFSLEVLQGTYTLQVRASGYYPASDMVTVAGGATEEMDMFLEPFVGMPGEIAYDDGTAENAWGYYAAGNGWAVRMSPPAGQGILLRGARFFLWDASWPSPGGNTFQAAVYEANADGSPGRMLGSPVSVTNATRGDWNDVDFSSLGLVLNGDFFVAYIQDAAYPNVPGMSVDETSPKTDRNWALSSGNWSPWEGDGNWMIRAMVDFEVGAPMITAPADGSFTNNPDVMVSGTAVAGTTVMVKMDSADAGSAMTTPAGTWSMSVRLSEGAHELEAIAAAPGGGTTLPSAPVAITLDTVMPALTVDSPAVGAAQNSRIIMVAGRVVEAHLRHVKVNGLAVTVGADGAFTTELVGAEGSNSVSVEAADQAGNVIGVNRTVMIDSMPPALSALQPASGMTLYTGDSVTVAFDSEPGLGLAAFQIGVGSAGTASNVKPMSLEPGEIAMREVRPGHYEATWTVPDGMSANAAYVRFRAVDAAGNATRMTAPGALRIVDNNRPVAVIRGPSTGRVNALLSYDGKGSTDSDGQVVSWSWNWGDGTTGTGSRAAHRWARPGTYTVTLTVTDDKGATATSSMQVTIVR